ncbi:hypothetical protein [Chryseobacterium sp. EO14]|uniref:hypothetical protein n=1 Tax=Chryseobacterium sp. EO14 TaxID=2950551 RepID=UPI002109EA56|nr:hypothetical protein [Chryseobacterium sp. EO14]MCQ4139205.1 hypothetical protein [Chryseobacterium sp. EO14]
MQNTKPILFSTPMVQAIMEDRKTQTRRIVKSKHESGMFRCGRDKAGNITEITSLDWDHRPKNDSCNDIKPICNVGDILWVRETFHIAEENEFGIKYIYKADVLPNLLQFHEFKPSIFMPKDAARIFLEVTNIRVERLQDISEDDARDEGARKGIFRMGPNTERKEFQLEHNNHGSYIDGFKFIWCNINGLELWEENPFVWVYEFKRIEKPKYF